MKNSGGKILSVIDRLEKAINYEVDEEIKLKD